MMNNIAKFAFVAFLLGLSGSVLSQNIGFNSTGATPSQNAILDLNTGNSNNLGLLIPNVTLGASLATFNPPIAHAPTAGDAGMMVYNSVATNQLKGFYFWDGSLWVSVGTFPGSNWVINGNTGSMPSTSLITSPANNNFMGTTDAKDLVFATNNLERMRILSGGSVGIGTKIPVNKLDDSGSYGVGISNVSPAAASVTALGNGYSTLVATPSAVGTTYTLTLPSATANARRIYTVVYNGKGLGTIDITSPVAGSIIQNGSAVTPLAVTQGTVTLQSDGTNWDILNITTANSFGIFVGIKYITATTAATAFDAGTASVLVKVTGGGGAGGGGSTDHSHGCGAGAIRQVAGSGGGAGGYVEGFVNGLSGSSTFAATIGAGGVGTAACSGTGGAGGTTTLTISNPGITFTANGGNGGINSVGDSVNLFAAGATGGTATSTGAVGTFLTIQGGSGGASLMSWPGAWVFVSTGAGAASSYGSGGGALIARVNSAPGVSSVSYGAGGGGALITQQATSTAGGNGGQGVIIIYEYQ